MIDMSVRADMKEIQRSFRNLEKRTINMATNRTINETGRYVFSRLVRSVAKLAGAKQKDLKRRFMRTMRSSFRRLEFNIFVKEGTMPLKDFNPKQTKAGVRAKAWGQSKVYDSAFIVNSLGQHVFHRTNELNEKGRQKIDKMFGPAPAKITVEREVDAETRRNIRTKFRESFARNLKFYYGKQ